MANLRWRRHRHWAFVVLVGVWTTYFLSPVNTPLEWVIALFAVLGAAAIFWRPVEGNLVLLIASLISAEFGIEYGRTELVLPVIGGLYVLGRSRAHPSVGLLFVGAQIATTLLRDGAPLASLPTQLIVFATPWLFGRIVASRAHSALRAVNEAERLAAIDVARVATGVAEFERQRVIADSIETLSTALSQIQQRTIFALQQPRDDRVAAIQDAAKAAIERLHHTLGTLRAAQPSVALTGAGQANLPSRIPRARRTLVSIAVPVLGTLVMLLFSAPLDSEWYRPVSIIPALVLPAAALLAPRIPVISALAAAGALLVAALDTPHPPEALIPCAVPLAALCWRLAQHESRQRPWAIAMVTVASPVLGMHHGLEGVGFSLLLVFLGVVCGFVWADRDALLQREEARAAKLTSRLAAARIGAAREERIRVARELHDVVSHAVAGVSVQAQLARIRLDENPDEGRAALTRILAATQQASHDLKVIARMLQPAPDELDVWRLVDNATGLGLRVSPYMYDSLRHDELAYRVVQESLTNASRYAPGTDVEVRVTREHGEVQVLVRNSAPDAVVLAELGSGSGLRGLRERVEARSGTLVSGPWHAEGGFEVLASWPSVESGRATVDDANHGEEVRP